MTGMSKIYSFDKNLLEIKVKKTSMKNYLKKSVLLISIIG
jgi:hypothetical protein